MGEHTTELSDGDRVQVHLVTEYTQTGFEMLKFECPVCDNTSDIDETIECWACGTEFRLEAELSMSDTTDSSRGADPGSADGPSE